MQTFVYSFKCFQNQNCCFVFLTHDDYVRYVNVFTVNNNTNLLLLFATLSIGSSFPENLFIRNILLLTNLLRRQPTIGVFNEEEEK